MINIIKIIIIAYPLHVMTACMRCLDIIRHWVSSLVMLSRPVLPSSVSACFGEVFTSVSFSALKKHFQFDEHLLIDYAGQGKFSLLL